MALVQQGVAESPACSVGRTLCPSPRCGGNTLFIANADDNKTLCLAMERPFTNHILCCTSVEVVCLTVHNELEMNQAALCLPTIHLDFLEKELLVLSMSPLKVSREFFR